MIKNLWIILFPFNIGLVLSSAEAEGMKNAVNLVCSSHEDVKVQSANNKCTSNPTIAGKIESTSATRKSHLSQSSVPDHLTVTVNMDHTLRECRNAFDGKGVKEQFVPMVKSIKQDPKPYQNIFKILKTITVGKQANRLQFSFTQPMWDSTHALYVVAGVTDKFGRTEPRLFWRSLSDGVWRCSHTTSTVYEGADNAFLILGKGLKHYTQETKVDRAIAAQLDEFVQIDKFTGVDEFLQKTDTLKLSPTQVTYLLCQFLIGDDPFYSKQKEFKPQEEMNKLLFDLLDVCKPGYCFSKRNALKCSPEYIQKVNKMIAVTGFLPNFKNGPIAQYKSKHLILGDVDVKVFEGEWEGQKFEWHFASDKEGNIWIDRIVLSNDPIGTYGVRKTLVNSGFLTNKPLEYAANTTAIKDPKRYGPYVLITPAFSSLLPIVEFKKWLEEAARSAATKAE